MKNAVLALRAQQISESRREFNARGAKMTRCQQCLLAELYCICEGVVQADCDAAVCLLMYHNESFKPSNTGRLIAEIVPENYAFRWDRTDPDAKLLALINDPQYQPMVVFPAEDVEPGRAVTEVNITAGKKPLFIFLDGTWREAKKMIRKSPYLDNLPVLSITAEQTLRLPPSRCSPCAPTWHRRSGHYGASVSGRERCSHKTRTALYKIPRCVLIR